MDLQRSHQSLSAPEADVSAGDAQEAVLHWLPQYSLCIGLGLLGGAVGVALAIGLAITIQLRLPPPAEGRASGP